MSKRTIVIPDSNIFIYSKKAFVSGKEKLIKKFWFQLAQAYDVYVETSSFEAEVLSKEEDQHYLQFLNLLLKNKFIISKELPKLVPLESKEREVVNKLKSRSYNDEKRLSRIS